MKTGIFCRYENYDRDPICSFKDQVKLIRHAESLGFNEAWVTEERVNSSSVIPSLILLARLADITSKIRLGSAAILSEFHSPIGLAEHIATIDNFCQGRFALGIGKSDPLPKPNKPSSRSIGESHAKALESMEMLCHILHHHKQVFQGRHYQFDGRGIFPEPIQRSMPIYVASGDEDSIEFAANRSFGLIGNTTASLSKLKRNVELYRSINSSGSENMRLIRFFFVARTYDEAASEALPFIRNFSAKMKSYSIKVFQRGSHQYFKLLNCQSSFNEEELLAKSIIGDAATCRRKLQKIQEGLKLETLILQPASFNFRKNMESLTRYDQEVRACVVS